MSKVTVGADPEVWLVDTSLGKIVPSCGLVGGTKDRPLPLKKGLAKGFAVQEDNVAVEFNIPPAHNLEQWVTYIQTGLTSLKEYLAAKGPYTFTTGSHHKFTKEQLSSDQAQAFGCSKDFNAYENGDEFPRIDPKELGGHRYCGGHLHIGYNADDVPPFVAAAFADLMIGLRMVGEDPQTKRRELYGQPGRYRPTSYGIEYRTPSNYWLGESMGHVGQLAFMFGQYLCDTPVKSLRNAYQKVPWGAVRKAIVENDLGLSQQVQGYLVDENLVYTDDVS
jgi:hypothetical protein